MRRKNFEGFSLDYPVHCQFNLYHIVCSCMGSEKIVMILTCGCDVCANCCGTTVTAGVSEAAVSGASACFDPPGTGIGGKSTIKNKSICY